MKLLRKAVYLLLAVALILAESRLLKADFTSFLKWWVTVALIGIIFLPVSSLIFHKFHDKGYLFAKVFGIAVTGYLMWLLSSVHIMKFTRASCMISVGVAVVFNFVLCLLCYYYSSAGKQKVSFKTRLLSMDRLVDTILGEELLFVALFLFFAYIRGFKPEAYGTEKFMDYGFMTSMMRSDFMPPEDFWFSGTNLNYYYVGQYMAAFLTKLSGVKVAVGYNLMLMMVGAFAVVLTYSLVYNVTQRYVGERNKRGRLIPVISGLTGGIAVCLAGNMHYPVYRWFEPLVRKFFGMEAGTDRYWFPDATRFIGYHPETNDKTIHEFPAYSFVLGDLHAHVINIMFVLTVLGILFAWMSSRTDKKEQRIPVWRDVFHPALIAIAFFIGLFHTTNFWDYPIYYVVSGAVILFTNIKIYQYKVRKILLVTALQGGFIFLSAQIIALPFTLRFDQISTNICLAVAHTPLNQLIILWGLPVFVIISFLCFMIADARRHKVQHGKEDDRKPEQGRLFDFVSVSDLFILTIGLCAIGLVLIPELIYVEDIYSGDYKRANTMFKLTYQAFIMFGVSFGYVFLRLFCYGRTLRQRKTAVVSIFFFVLSVCYIQNAVNAWYGNIFKPSEYEGLDATAFMESTMPDDDIAIQWLNEHITGTPVVLEAPGDSYTDYQRVSVMTGLPTVLGWHTHEWLWKGDSSLLDVRSKDIETIYTSEEAAEVRQLLDLYHITYIYVGKLEQDKYTSVNNILLKSLGDVVFLSPVDSSKDYETYIVKVR